jgi:polysaccharide pyruvyl transferase WcaK-like protein
MKNSEIKSIGIFGHYGNLNLGDEAIITAVIENINHRYSDAQLTCFSVNPQETESRYGITSFPIRPLASGNGHVKVENTIAEPSSKNANESGAAEASIGLKSRVVAIVKKIPFVASSIRFVQGIPEFLKSLPGEIAFSKESVKILKSVDLLIIAGSNQFLDNFGGPWGFPFTLLRWSILAKMAKVKITYVSVGAGPLEAKLSTFLCRSALRFADYASFRDIASQKMMVTNTANSDSFVYPDLAFSLLNKPQATNGKKEDPNQRLKVGINVMAIYDPRYWCEPDGSKYSQYVNNLAVFAQKLMRDNVDIFFFGTQKKDEPVIQDVLTVLGEKTDIVMDDARFSRYSETVYGLLDVIAEADIVVATRFHGTVLSLFSEKPTLGVCYYRKSADLLKAAGQGDYYVDIDNFDPEELYNKFNLLAAEKSREIKKLQKMNSEYSSLLADQYNAVLN